MAYLEIKNFKKTYEDKVVFQNISFNAKKGEFITLLGPSGCGKSTLLRCIAGLSRINEGKILINDKDITKLSPQKRNIGMVFQNYALFPNLNVFENIAFGLKIKKMDKKDIEKRVKKMLKLVELEEYIKTYPHKLSGGQMQRVALARSLIIKPNLLLLDEPLSALDAKIRKHLRMQIKEIQKELNLTTIFVTHDQEEALELSDRIILMNEGKIMQNSSANNLYLLPECHFVAGFIGSYNILSPKELDNLGLQHNFKKDIALRPETIEISNKGLKAKIKQKLLLGNVIRYLVKLQEIELKVDTLNFSIYSTFEVGDKIALRFNLSLAKELK
ncbi:ABC transporter ATP-binding protein [Campylobacter hepaticus]|uniref:ABC transporter ATP-binding protein n=1 Tax=Campylobacter hepaticus TaxID=1813019 RepID=A0A424YZZ1_9BACT|nr:ABC transporter ATP-binding protein [Campylobacter hepaticus]RQD69058.1 ABC transporter ATP-binding protein [Campylobacter hepaticus]RQD87225.1 ABC transporter ATP-binding protein [Campylobacter hepaticus]